MLHKIFPYYKNAPYTGTILKTLYKRSEGGKSIELSFENRIENNLKDMSIKDYLSLSYTGKNLEGKSPNLEVSMFDISEDTPILVSNSPRAFYVIDTDKDAKLHLGFREDLLEAPSISDLKSKIGEYDLRKGNCYFIPRNTIFSLPKSAVLYEITESNASLEEVNESNISSISLKKYIPSRVPRTESNKGPEAIAISGSFELLKADIKNFYTIRVNERSFSLITIISGNPKLDSIEASAGESFFLDPESLIKVEGESTILIARIPRLLIGLDVGGTSIKGMIIDDIRNKVAESKVITEPGEDRIIKSMVEAANILSSRIGEELSYFNSIGAGIPGSVSKDRSTVIFADNIGLRNVKLKEKLEKIIGIDVVLENDASCAALGEYLYTDKNKYHDVTVITLGTGLGSGFIVDGKLFRGGQGSTTELGHIKVKNDGHKCGCGQYGCLEALTSLSRIKEDIAKLREDPSNGIAELLPIDRNPADIFRLANENEACKKYTFKYLNNLLLGLVNVANILQPEVICLGGGVSYAIRKFIPYLDKKLNQMKYGGEDSPYIRVVPAELGNEAGGFGACALSDKELWKRTIFGSFPYY